jgi:hypothetical protein
MAVRRTPSSSGGIFELHFGLERCARKFGGWRKVVAQAGQVRLQRATDIIKWQRWPKNMRVGVDDITSFRSELNLTLQYVHFVEGELAVREANVKHMCEAHHTWAKVLIRWEVFALLAQNKSTTIGRLGDHEDCRCSYWSSSESVALGFSCGA